MRVTDAEKFWTNNVNKMLSRIYYGSNLIGQARKGLDGMWYPELTAKRTRAAAIHEVILATEAIKQSTVANGHD